MVGMLISLTHDHPLTPLLKYTLHTLLDPMKYDTYQLIGHRHLDRETRNRWLTQHFLC